MKEMERKKFMAIMGSGVLIGFASKLLAAVKPVENTARKNQKEELKKVKQDIKDILKPGEVNAITDIDGVKDFLKKQQKTLKPLFKLYFRDI